jgi:hypothetical protein
MILMKLVNFRRLKLAVGHDYVNETKFKLKLFINCQLIKIKFTFKDRLNGNNCCWQNWPNGATERDLGDRETVPGHQGAAVVPADSVATHEIERPETHD